MGKFTRRKLTGSKRIEQRKKEHATHRALSRFGLELSARDLKEIAQMIQRQEGRFIERQSNRVTQWEVTYRDKLMLVVYDTKRKLVVTFLYPESQRSDGVRQ